MTRGRLVLSFLLFIALCASIAYWGLQLYDPPLRPVAASAQPQTAPPSLEAAAAVFGGQAATETANNFQLRGVIYSGTPKDSVAIIAQEGKPPRAFRVNGEVVPGVTVKEVHREYVVLSDGGALKRIELPAAGRNAQVNGIARRASSEPPVSATPQQAAQPQTAQPQTNQSQSAAQPQNAPAQGTTVVTQQEEQAPQNEGAAQSDQADSSATSINNNETQDDAAAETAAPAQMQDNPPRRQ